MQDGNKDIQRLIAQKRVNEIISNYDENCHRNCCVCKIQKQNKDFYKNISINHYGGKSFRIRTECKECIKKRLRDKFNQNYHHNLEKKRIAYRNKHKFKNIKSQYGIEKDEYFVLITKSNGICSICNKKINNPQIDHCHKTGKVRGILCANCNLGLGNFKDDINSLKNAIKYLEKSVSRITLKSAKQKGE